MALSVHSVTLLLSHRKRSPYKWKDGENVVRKNSVRLAEVWMDDYKEYYYERINHDLVPAASCFALMFQLSLLVLLVHPVHI